MCGPTSGKAVLKPLVPWKSAAAQKTRVKKLILAVNGLCDATLTRYGTKMGLLEGLPRQGRALRPVLHTHSMAHARCGRGASWMRPGGGGLSWCVARQCTMLAG